MPNFVAAYEDYAASRTSAPAAFHTFAAIMICAAALEDRVYVEAKYGRLYPALWMCFVGPSTVHKSTAVNIACNLMRAAKKETEIPNDFSREALVEHLSHRPYGLLRWSEISSALEAFAKDYNAGVLSTLTDLWDSRPSMTRLTKSAGLVEITYPSLSIFGAGKIRWFQEYIRPRQIGGGFVGRWLFVMETEDTGYKPMFSKNGPSEADRLQRDSLIEHLQQLTQHEGGEMLPGDGGVALDEWLRTVHGKWSDDEDPAEFSKRAHAQVTKLAIGIQAARGTSYLGELHPKAVQQAIDLWLYSFEHSRKLVDSILNRGRDSDALDSVLRMIKREGSIRRRDLCRRTKITTKVLNEYMETFITGGLVAPEQRPTEGGGPATVWYHYVG